LIAAVDSDGRTALHWACKQPSTRPLDLLLKVQLTIIHWYIFFSTYALGIEWAIARRSGSAPGHRVALGCDV
jgi:hypothetical protein